MTPMYVEENSIIIQQGDSAASDLCCNVCQQNPWTWREGDGNSRNGSKTSAWFEITSLAVSLCSKKSDSR